MSSVTNFNSDSRVHTEIHDTDKQDSPRIAQIKSLMGKIGIPIDNISALYAEGGGWKGLWKKMVGSEAFQVGLTSVVAYGAGEVAEGVSGGTAGALAGLAVEAAHLFGKVTGQKIVPTFKPGEWVAIDDGSIQISKKVRAGMAWTMGAIFEDFPEREEEELETERVVSFGFVVGESSSPGKVTVFNFETGEKEDKNKLMLIPLSRERQDLLNENEQMITIKEIIINDKPAQAKKLRCEVPCDPGEEVIYVGKPYRVISCDGLIVRVTDGQKHYDLHMKDVTRGRVKHTNAWNYGAKTDSGFDSDSRSRLFAGQWAWIAPRALIQQQYIHSRKELVCLRVIKGDIVQGYYALDGVRFDTHLSQVHPVIQERQGFLDSEPSLKLFKSYAIKGSGNVRNFHASDAMILICIGLGTFNKELLAPGTQKSLLDGNLHHTEEVVVYGTPGGITPEGVMSAPGLLTQGERDEQDGEYTAQTRGGTRSDRIRDEKEQTFVDKAKGMFGEINPVTAGVVLLGVGTLFYVATVGQ